MHRNWKNNAQIDVDQKKIVGKSVVDMMLESSNGVSQPTSKKILYQQKVPRFTLDKTAACGAVWKLHSNRGKTVTRPRYTSDDGPSVGQFHLSAGQKVKSTDLHLRCFGADVRQCNDDETISPTTLRLFHDFMWVHGMPPIMPPYRSITFQ